jgi:hypothetical protein
VSSHLGPKLGQCHRSALRRKGLLHTTSTCSMYQEPLGYTLCARVFEMHPADTTRYTLINTPTTRAFISSGFIRGLEHHRIPEVGEARVVEQCEGAQHNPRHQNPKP